MRTQEQIIADCEKRYAELRAEADRRASDPLIQRPCGTCRWLSPIGDGGFYWRSEEYVIKYGTCTEPLVQGFEKYGKRASAFPMPCGKEKALWQPKPTPRTRIQRIIDWLCGETE